MPVDVSVTPRVGVWIETSISLNLFKASMSPLAWGCGLKLSWHGQELHRRRVTPRVGVWIETAEFVVDILRGCVTPRVGVWIETSRLSF